MYIFGRLNHLCTINLFSSVIKDDRKCISNMYFLFRQSNFHETCACLNILFKPIIEKQVFIKEKKGHSFICTKMYIFARLKHLCTIHLFSLAIKDGLLCIPNSTPRQYIKENHMYML